MSERTIGEDMAAFGLEQAERARTLAAREYQRAISDALPNLRGGRSVGGPSKISRALLAPATVPRAAILVVAGVSLLLGLYLGWRTERSDGTVAARRGRRRTPA